MVYSRQQSQGSNDIVNLDLSSDDMSELEKELDDNEKNEEMVSIYLSNIISSEIKSLCRIHLLLTYYLKKFSMCILSNLATLTFPKNTYYYFPRITSQCFLALIMTICVSLFKCLVGKLYGT